MERVNCCQVVGDEGGKCRQGGYFLVGCAKQGTETRREMDP